MEQTNKDCRSRKGFGSRGSYTSGEPQHLVCCFETLAVCTFAESAMAGAAVRRRQRFLRSMWRHEQLSLKMMAASMSHHSWQSRESVGVQTDAAPTPVVEYVAPAGAPCAVTADITQLMEPPIPDKLVAPVSPEYVTPAPVDFYAVIDYAALANTVIYIVPATTGKVAPASTVSNRTPALVIEHMPAPVIEFFVPPPTVFYPSFSQ